MGYAYNGGGNEVQRVEVSLDGGVNWLYCVRKVCREPCLRPVVMLFDASDTEQFPEAPLRHGKKFWTWLHWHVDIDITQLLRAEQITVRCWDVNKNTQPENPTWNLEG